MNRRGFSLIEMLIVIAITAVIAGASALLLFNRQGTADLQATAQEMVSALRTAQQNAVTAASSTAWGVRFDNTTSTAPRFVVFASSSYAKASEATEYRMSSRVMYDSVSVPASTSKDIVFAIRTGTTASTSVTIATKSGKGSYVINVSSAGLVTATQVATTAATSTAPTVSGLAPTTAVNTGNVSVSAITGTGFVSGATVSLRRAGQSAIAGSGFSVSSPTSISGGTFNLAGAQQGAWDVQVTNPDGQSGSCSGCFTVTTQGAPPTATAVSPVGSPQGSSNVSVTITGTNFVSGATAAFSGTGITVNGTTFVSQTQLTTNISISGSAPTGTRTVTVTNPDAQSGSCTNCFSVNLGAPTVTAVAPGSRGQGAQGVTLTLTGTNFVTGSTPTFSGTGITVVASTVNSATQMSAIVNIAAGEATGARNVTVTNPDTQSGSGTGLFTINQAPTISGGTPTHAMQGATFSLAVTGANFISGTSLSFSGSGITVNSVTVNSATSLTASVSIASNAASGARDTTVTNPDGGTNTYASSFTVDANNGLVGYFSFDESSGSSATDAVSASSAPVTGTTIATTGCYSGNCRTFDGSSYVTASVTRGATASFSWWASWNGYEPPMSLLMGPEGAGPDVFFYNGQISWNTWDSASNSFGSIPSSASNGQVHHYVLVNDQGANNAKLYYDGTLLGTAGYRNASGSTLVIGGANGYRWNGKIDDVRVYDKALSASEVTQLYNTPKITGVSPSSGAQGASGLALTVTGSGFTSGSTASFSGTGITVTGTTINSDTSATVTVNIASNATVGTRDLTITNSSGRSGVLTGGFSVTSASGLLARWALDDGSGITVADATGNGYAGTLNNGPTWQSSGCLAGGCLSFDGVDDFVNMGDVLDAGTQSRTLSVWVKTTSASSMGIIGKGYYGSLNGRYSLSMDSSYLYGLSQGSPGNIMTQTSSAGIRDGQWHHLAMVWDRANGVYTYVDGALVGQDTSKATIGENYDVALSFLIGWYNASPSGTQYFSGSIDEARVYAGALTSSEVAALAVRPQVTSISPSSASQGATGTSLTITGSNFVSGATTAFSGSGVTVTGTTFNSTTQLTVTVNVSASALAGSRDITVTNPDGRTGTKTGGFTVTAATTPTITSISPTSQPTGVSSINVTINGTNFASGASASFSGTGITVNSTTFVSATRVRANITIASNAPTGARSITVTNPDSSSATASNVFTVNAQPTFTSASPSSGAAGASNLTVIVNGTGFQSGGSAILGGTGITVNSITFINSTQLALSLTIAAGASKDTRYILIVNPDQGSVMAPNAFTVN